MGTCCGNGIENSEVKDKNLEQKLREFIAKDFQSKGRVELERVFLHGSVPADARVIAVEPSPALGVISFELSGPDSSGLNHVFGTASSKVYLPIVVAKTAIRNNEPFTIDNCILREKEISAYRFTGYYESFEAMKSFRARGFINPGMVIGYNHTQSPFIVNAGESVQLVSASPGIQVSVRARAVENGREGQWIKVENLSNKRVVQARVTSQGTVSVH